MGTPPQQIELDVAGMACGACEGRITAALSRLEGVWASAADHRSGKVRVLFDPELASTGAVRSRITQAGYRLDDGDESRRP